MRLLKKDTHSPHNDQAQSPEWPSGKITSSPVALIHSDLANDECPHVKLPAAHLSLRQAAHIGWLIEPRRFCNVKRYYAGVLDGWLLMYSSDEAPIPSSYYALKRCIWTNSKLSKDKFRLTQITTSSDGAIKQRHFKINSHKDFQEWVMAVTESKPASSLNLFGSRKLPTPPSSRIGSHTLTSASNRTSTISQEADLNMDDALAPPSSVNQRQEIEPIYDDPRELLPSLYLLKPPRAMASADIAKAVVGTQIYDIPKPNPRPVTPTEPMPTEHPAGSSETPNQSFQQLKSSVAAQLIAIHLNKPVGLKHGVDRPTSNV